jgi:enoyl-CoA hydratase/carnithine racemase
MGPRVRGDDNGGEAQYVTQPLLIKHDDGIDRVTLDRPESLNALNPDMIDASGIRAFLEKRKPVYIRR